LLTMVILLPSSPVAGKRGKKVACQLNNFYIF
jgi:hypothetical protein